MNVCRKNSSAKIYLHTDLTKSDTFCLNSTMLEMTFHPEMKNKSQLSLGINEELTGIQFNKHLRMKIENL